jgi:hypothetical protein
MRARTQFLAVKPLRWVCGIPKILSQLEFLQDKGTRKSPQSRTLAGHIAPKSFPMRKFYKIPALNSIRTNPTFALLKFTTFPQLINSETVEYYL